MTFLTENAVQAQELNYCNHLILIKYFNIINHKTGKPITSLVFFSIFEFI